VDFDKIIDRRGTHSAKWDKMEDYYGVSPDDGIAMWVADMDFHAPDTVRNAVRDYADSVYGYFGDDSDYRAAICWWMKERHGWPVDPAHIFSTHGLGNGIGLCLDAFTDPGDGVVLFTPVYHAFATRIRASNRQVVECEMPLVDGRYELDFEAWDAQMSGKETMLIFCSPHNPGGRVWTREELEQVADFARRHDLILLSDEIHHDLVFPGSKHIPMTAIDGITDRLVMATAPSKTFNTAGLHTGQVTIADETLRARFGARIAALGITPNSVGLVACTAAYSPEGARWVDALVNYLDGNRELFDAGVNAIPGVQSIRLEATYLAWVDFAGTGMDMAEVKRRVQQVARVAPNHGETFGKGGETFLRFNLGTQRTRVEEAVHRLREAFSDLQ